MNILKPTNFLQSPLCLLATALVFLPGIIDAQTASSVAEVGELPPLPPEVKFAIMTLGGGGIAGWAVGFTLKKFAKMAAFAVGIAFISLQILAFNSFITIDWERIKTAVPDESIEKSATTVMSVITYNLPFAGAFLAGFWIGFRKG